MNPHIPNQTLTIYVHLNIKLISQNGWDSWPHFKWWRVFISTMLNVAYNLRIMNSSKRNVDA